MAPRPLFLDRNGTPGLVEVKRTSNPRAHCKVVGQMLDYAASFGVGWSAERVRLLAESRARPVASEDELDEFLAPTPYADDHGKLLTVGPHRLHEGDAIATRTTTGRCSPTGN